ncbi:MAG TPA: hypothetical protein ENI79_01435 [Rhodospirillales bacterium]|nr:hypothetical protein [Rhodospirillales bacterium]
MSDNVTRAVRVLNEALEQDPGAIVKLINLRVDCNNVLAAHPTIKAGVYEDVFRIGVLGLLNGVLSETPGGVIGAEGRVDEKTGRFTRIKRFVDLRKDRIDEMA